MCGRRLREAHRMAVQAMALIEVIVVEDKDKTC
jgi:hypothetical protein